MLLGLSGLLSGCFLEETPWEIDQRLLPQIAEDLIKNHTSEKIIGLTPEMKEAFRRHGQEDLQFQIGSPNKKADSGVKFFSKKTGALVISIGLDLHMSKDRYRLESFVENGKKIP